MSTSGQNFQLSRRVSEHQVVTILQTCDLLYSELMRVSPSRSFCSIRIRICCRVWNSRKHLGNMNLDINTFWRWQNAILGGVILRRFPSNPAWCLVWPRRENLPRVEFLVWMRIERFAAHPIFGTLVTDYHPGGRIIWVVQIPLMGKEHARDTLWFNGRGHQWNWTDILVELTASFAMWYDLVGRYNSRDGRNRHFCSLCSSRSSTLFRSWSVEEEILRL